MLELPFQIAGAIYSDCWSYIFRLLELYIQIAGAIYGDIWKEMGEQKLQASYRGGEHHLRTRGLTTKPLGFFLRGNF